MNKTIKRTLIVILLITIITLLIQNVKEFMPIKGVENNITILINDSQKIIFKNNKKDVKDKNLEILDIEQGLKIKNISKSLIIINDKKIYPNQTKIIKVKELTKKNRIPIKVMFKETKKYKEYKINTLPNDFRDWEIEGKSKYKGDYYTEIRTKSNGEGVISYLAKINTKGQIIFYKKVKGILCGFKKLKVDGKVRYIYMVGNSDIDGVPFNIMILDENYKQIGKINYINKDKSIEGIDRHDVVYIKDNHYIVSTVKDKTVNNFPEELGYGNTMKVQATLVEEIKDGKVLWEFDSTDYPELYKYFNQDGVYGETPSKEYYSNYMHFNSFAIDPKDNNLVVSFRNICSLIKINRKTGKIMWILGGDGDEFGLKEDQKFLYQHSISFVDKDTMLLYDNGFVGAEHLNQNFDNIGPTLPNQRQSRIVKIKIDERNKKVEKYESYNLGVYTRSWGSVQPIKSDTYLIDYGFAETNGKSIVEEKDLKTGKVYFKFEFIGYPAAHVWKDI